MTTKEKIMELSNNIANKYAPLHGCENCWGDLHQGCSKECKHEFEVRMSMRDDIKNALDQIREETTHQCYQDIDKLLIKKGLEDFAILREERDKAVKEATHQCYQELREKVEGMMKKPGRLYIPIPSVDTPDHDVGFIYNTALSDLLQLLEEK